MCAVVLIALATTLTGCTEGREQSSTPNAFAKETYTYSYSLPDKSESVPQEQTAALAINGDVMWGIGKTVDELSEKYGTAKEWLTNVYTFDNGLVWYNCSDNGFCRSVHGVKPADFLVGDISTVTLDNLAEKCGFNTVPMYDTGSSETMYEGYRMAYYTHPDYTDYSFELFYNEEGFDDTAEFSVRYYGTAATTNDLIVTLNAEIDSAADVEALKTNVKRAVVGTVTAEAHAFENPDAFVADNEMTAGALSDGAVVLVKLSDGSCYITVRGDRTTQPVPVPIMLANIVQRANSVKQLAEELRGYGRGGTGMAANRVSVYENGEAADAGDDSGKTIIEGGNVLGTDDDLKNGVVCRVEYGGWDAYVSFALGEI